MGSEMCIRDREINGDEENLLSDELIEETFAPDYGRTLNLNDLQQRMKALQASVAGQGYSWRGCPVRNGSALRVWSR